MLLFEQRYGFKNQTFAVELINGGVNDQNATTASDGEANLDAQNIIGIAHGLEITEYITGGESTIQARRERSHRHKRALLAILPVPP